MLTDRPTIAELTEGDELQVVLALCWDNVLDAREPVHMVNFFEQLGDEIEE